MAVLVYLAILLGMTHAELIHVVNSSFVTFCLFCISSVFLLLSILSEQQRRLLRKPYNRPTASSVISLVKEFRAVTSPWVQGKEKVADANEEDEDAIVPAVGKQYSYHGHMMYMYNIK